MPSLLFCLEKRKGSNPAKIWLFFYVVAGVKKNIDLRNEKEMEDIWLLFGGSMFEFDSEFTFQFV
jgi:hypothetical protein